MGYYGLLLETAPMVYVATAMICICKLPVYIQKYASDEGRVWTDLCLHLYLYVASSINEPHNGLWVSSTTEE